MHKGANCVSADTPVAEVAALMKNDDIGSVPVCENDRIVGMITDRDLALRLLSLGQSPEKLTAADVMTKGIIYCRTDQSVDDAIHLMEDKQVRRLPVIDDDKRLVGMLSLGDIAHHVSRELAGELVQSVAASHG